MARARTKKELPTYGKELFFARDAKTGKYEPNTRKLYCAVSWALLLAYCGFCLCLTIYFLKKNKISEAPWTAMVTALGIFVSNAQASVGWYTSDKNSKRRNGIK